MLSILFLVQPGTITELSQLQKLGKIYFVYDQHLNSNQVGFLTLVRGNI